MYIVKYSTGEYEDYHEVCLFVTEKKINATKYVTKFNSILRRWKQYLSKYEHIEYGNYKWIKEEYIEKWYSRWSSIRQTNKCWYEEIEVR